MKATDAARAALLASQPGPKIEKARTPMAAQPIWAMKTLYFCNDEAAYTTQKLTGNDRS